MAEHVRHTQASGEQHGTRQHARGGSHGSVTRRAGLASMMVIALCAAALLGNPAWGHHEDVLYYVPAPSPCAHGCVVHLIARTGFEIP